MSISIYEQLGEDMVSLLVTIFYDKVLADDRINYFFSGTELSVLLDHQTKFIMTALGGEDKYIGRSLAVAHQSLVDDLGLNAEHFDIMTNHLKTSMQELECKPNVIETVIDTILTYKDQVLAGRSGVQ